MVRVFLKGGVWKNSEDEILKAAVQKYGKQQWARVASLLNRKSAKQCKARWHEWLDPSVRKVEWSREEEEKLLHLAKLMPAQWKTIGPLVGRTASQCQEHYEALLDEAATASGGADGGDESTTASLRAQSQQQLRPGQIDSHPETKPARPDPIDMDEDEIEMLQEARARLANTQGKKAKRKAREKMLQEAKRLADLQKRRELKQAGLLSSAARKKAKKRNRDIDLGVEIPFHKPAPAGFHDVSSEDARAESIRKKQQSSIDFKKLNESHYRSRDREAAKAKKREEARLRTLEKSNMQYVVAQVSKTNDPLNIRKRGPLQLPAPTVTDSELTHIAKLNQEQQNAATLPLENATSGAAATQALLGDYSDRPLPTPMRTPMTGGGISGAASSMSKQESILREASNLRMLERGQTPLLGGENPELKGDDAMDRDRDSKPSARLDAATPGAPALDRSSVGGRTPSIRRDELGLNRPQTELRSLSGGMSTMDDTASVGASTFATSTGSILSIRELARQERRAAKRARKQLEEALAALPAPQFEYELSAPADVIVDDDNDDGEKRTVETITEEDAADVEAAEQERLKQEAEKLYEARSSVVKRSDLPRPYGAIPDMSREDKLRENDNNSNFEYLVDEERWTLLRHDAHSFPVEPPPSLLESSEKKGKKKKSKKRKQSSSSSDNVQTVLPPETPLDYIPEDALNAAKDLMQSELEQVIKEKCTMLLSNGTANSERDARKILVEENTKNRGEQKAKIKNNEVFHSSNRWVAVNETNKSSDLLESLALEFDTLQEATIALRKKNAKAEAKLEILTGGYRKRAEETSAEIVQMFSDYRNSVIEEAVYRNLQHNEELGGAKRLDQLRDDIRTLEKDEAELQTVCQELTEVSHSTD